MDQFLENRPRRPKAEIADYVESNGILAPRRFQTVTDGLRAKVDLIIRSEHPDEYDGPSGLFDSAVIDEFHVDWAKRTDDDRAASYDRDKLRLQALRQRLNGGDDQDYLVGLRASEQSMAERYAEQRRVSVESVVEGISYSVWEKLGGVNHTVYEDPSISGRYLIFSNGGRSSQLAYAEIHDGAVFASGIDPELTGKIPYDKLIDSYQRIRNLPAFDEGHCPIMELQSLEGQVFFLQYHRGRDANPVGFTVHDLPEGWHQSFFTRGHTGPEPVSLDFTIGHSMDHPHDDTEEAAIDYLWDFVMEEVAVRKRKAQMIERKDENSVRRFMFGAAMGHSNKSYLFKPGVSFIAPLGELGIPEDYVCPRNTELREVIPLEFISDGRRSFVRFAG